MNEGRDEGWGLRSAARVLLRRRAREDALREWRRRLLGEPALPTGPLREVLVLCHGNICRSPFAAALLRARDPELRVVSAGLEAAEGNPADATALRIARELGVDLETHRSHRVSDGEIEASDLILAMEGHHADAVVRRVPASRPRVRLLGDFLDAPPYRIEDPWGRPEAVFREVFARLGRASDRLLERMGGRAR